MAHFAKIENGIVTQVVVVNNVEVLDETTGVNFCKSIFGDDTIWVQTSYNNNFRGRFAGVGMVYDSIRDIFVSADANEL